MKAPFQCEEKKKTIKRGKKKVEINLIILHINTNTLIPLPV